MVMYPNCPRSKGQKSELNMVTHIHRYVYLPQFMRIIIERLTVSWMTCNNLQYPIGSFNNFLYYLKPFWNDLWSCF